MYGQVHFKWLELEKLEKFLNVHDICVLKW